MFIKKIFASILIQNLLQLCLSQMYEYNDAPVMSYPTYYEQQVDNQQQFNEFKEVEKRHAVENQWRMFDDNNRNMNQRYANYYESSDAMQVLGENNPAETQEHAMITPLARQPGCGCTGGVDYLLGYDNPEQSSQQLSYRSNDDEVLGETLGEELVESLLSPYMGMYDPNSLFGQFFAPSE